jgi:glycosyl transferase family 87
MLPTSNAHRLRHALLGAFVAALAGHLIAGIAYARSSPEPAGDFDRYYAIASNPGRPYVDYQVEHPIVTLAVFKSIARLPGGRSTFGFAIVLLNIVGDAIIILSLWWGWGIAAAACYTVTVLPVIDLFFNRIDAWSTAAAVLALTLWKRRRPAAAGAAFAIGTGFKLWPLVLTPILIVPWRGRRSTAAGASFVLTCGALGAAAFSIAGASSLREVLTFRGATGWQIESTIGSLLNLFGSETPRLENNAFRIGALSAPLAIGLFAAALPLCFWATARSSVHGRSGSGWLAAVPALLLSSALFSAQYVIWLTPGAAVALTEQNSVGPALVLVSTALTQGFMQMYGAVVDHGNAGWMDGRLVARALVVLRNVIVLALAIHSTRQLFGASDDRMPEEEPGGEDHLRRGESARDLRQS